MRANVDNVGHTHIIRLTAAVHGLAPPQTVCHNACRGGGDCRPEIVDPQSLSGCTHAVLAAALALIVLTIDDLAVTIHTSALQPEQFNKAGMRRSFCYVAETDFLRQA